MANISIIGSVLKEAGIITIDGNRCVCGSCKATGRKETLNIRHAKDCVATQAVKSFIDSLAEDGKILPRVEHPIELDTMLPYYAEATSEEYTVADAIATAIFASATKGEREKLRKRIEQYEPATNARKDLVDFIIQNGLETNVDRVNFRNWLIYVKIWERKISLLEAEHYELECDKTRMDELFQHAFGIE